MWKSLVIIFVALHSVGAAQVFEGINLPEIRKIDGIELLMNGRGLRSIQFFRLEVKVYVAGFYSQIPLLSEEDVMTRRDCLMLLDFTFLRDISKNRVISAWRKQITYSSSFRYEELEEDTNLLIELLALPIPKGGTQSILIDGNDTTVFLDGVRKGSISGRNFQKASS